LRNRNEWVAFCDGKMPQLGDLPLDIPKAPRSRYATSGWKNFGDWLGTGTVQAQQRKYRPFVSARAFARSLKINSNREWIQFCHGEIPHLGELPPDIPTNIRQTYAEKGWNGIKDWLGTSD